ncbi:calmodulin-binding transcription activator 3-like [Iris pallida]|uniref:Calmodulin-binding transcription activator 3-like n=1 Tax=Iris pallida TaxID=29817 RepID=A0AAX6HKT3_IRIPA|nr:calmodulin-binding transcription activator 3-like [Iris pallida]
MAKTRAGMPETFVFLYPSRDDGDPRFWFDGPLFLFDLKVLRYFWKDGHNWRKKKGGMTVKEAHERLKAGSVEVLDCYYAHGEENENFQRRSYSMLEEQKKFFKVEKQRSWWIHARMINMTTNKWKG